MVQRIGILAVAAIALLGWTSVLAAAVGSDTSSEASSKPQSMPAPSSSAATSPAPVSTSWIDQGDQWIDQTKTPVPWMKWGADLRFRDEYLKSPGLNDHDAAPAFRESNWQRYRARWWMTLTPVKNLDLNLRIEWEGRHNSVPDSAIEWAKEAVRIDTANIKLTNVLDTPLTLTLGRQDILLGDGWLVFEGTPVDGSRTTFFDAARGTLEVKDIDTTFDFIYINQNARGNALVEPLLDFRLKVTEQNEQGFILWAANHSIKKTEIDGYYMYKAMQRVAANGDNGFIHTVGARIAGDIDEHWKYRAEGATQWGERNGQNLRAFGFNSKLTYQFKDPMDNQLRVAFEYLSGDNPGSKGTNEAWAPLWGRWPQWSELYGYVLPDTGDSRVYESTNLYRLAGGWSISPMPKMVLAADYHLLFAPENTKAGTAGFSDSGAFRGQLFTLLTTYQFSKHLKGHILAEFFCPGNYFASPRNDMATMLRGELVFTW
jgi:hypothetical protein